MRITWIVLIGIVAAVAYGIASHEITGEWNFSLSFVIGTVVALALSGFRLRQTAEYAVSATHANTGAGRASGDTNTTVDADPTESEDRLAGARAFSQPQSTDSDAALDGDSAISSAMYHPATIDYTSFPQPPLPTADHQVALLPSGETAEAIWNRARAMETMLDPELPVEECQNYMDLVFAAAEGGEVAALARLGELAFNRAAFVEAYFWTKLAYRRLELSDPSEKDGLVEIANMLCNIRREWTAAGQPPEFENVYDNFQEERGELGRAFLRMDSGKEVSQTRDYIQFLADKGNPDAELFARC